MLQHKAIVWPFAPTGKFYTLSLVKSLQQTATRSDALQRKAILPPFSPSGNSCMPLHTESLQHAATL